MIPGTGNIKYKYCLFSLLSLLPGHIQELEVREELQLRGEPHYLVVGEVEMSQPDEIVETGGETSQAVTGEVQLLQLRIGESQ